MAELVQEQGQATVRTIKELAVKAWGKDWPKPDVAYEFSGGRKFDSTDGQQGGIYSGTSA